MWRISELSKELTVSREGLYSVESVNKSQIINSFWEQFRNLSREVRWALHF